VHYILHDFFWIYDEYLEDLDEYASVDFVPMLSLESIDKIIETLNRFSNYLDDILKNRYEKREMFKKGPSIKK
jgi:hypothetical protein